TGTGLSASGSGTMNLGVNLNSGNASGQIPISNGTLCTNLNADMLDGHHWSEIPSIPANNVTGSGIATQVAYWNGSNSITGENNLYWNSTNDRLGIGTSSPTQALEVNGNALVTGNEWVSTSVSSSDGIRIGTSSNPANSRIYVAYDNTDIYGIYVTMPGWAIYGDASGGGGRGVMGRGGEAGVRGECLGSGSTWGALGYTDLSTNYFAGYFNGNTSIANGFGYYLNGTATNNAGIYTQSGSNRMFIRAETTSPVAMFHSTGLTLRPSAAGGYLNFGNSTAGSGGYGIRDNSGIIEYKNSGGSWTAFSGGSGDVIAGTRNDNYLTKWNTAAAKTITNSQLYDNGTNIGIGTTTPAYKLHVSASASSPNPVGYFNNTVTSNEGRGVIGICDNTDWYGIGVEGIGGYIGVKGEVTPSGSYQYTGVQGLADGGTGSNYGIYGSATGSGTNYGGYFIADDIGVYGVASSATGFGGRFQNTNASGTGLLASGNNIAGSYLTGGSGVAGSSSNVGVLGHGDATPASWGIYGITDASDGIGVYGEFNSDIFGALGTQYNGVLGVSNNTSGAGVLGNGGSTTSGIYGTTSASSDFGVDARNTNSSGTAIIGVGNNVTGSYLTDGSGGAFTGYSFGSYNKFTGSSIGNGFGDIGATGVYATGAFYDFGAATPAYRYGVCGYFPDANNYSNYSAGVIGIFNTANACVGALGYVNGFNSIIGVYGAQGDGHYAGYFSGDVYVNGTLSKTGGSFLIDHPDDPLNKTLRHNFVESPENLCLYRGKAVLNSEGSARIEMPDYYSSLTKEEEATVTLTSIGKPFNVGYDWNDNFTVFTIYGEPNREVSYMVLADRDDPVMQRLKKPVVESKGPENNIPSGVLFNPEAYGYPKEMGLDYLNKGVSTEITNILSIQNNQPTQKVFSNNKELNLGISDHSDKNPVKSENRKNIETNEITPLDSGKE
ncbi:hypothetical protein JW877_06050, partial [bacterium]|nr:hypothetical protein [bacterium]